MKLLSSLVLSLLIVAVTATQSYAAWAVAMGTDGLPTVSRAWSSVGTAQSDALSGCTKEGYKNCKIVASGMSGCLALANTGTTHTRWGVGQATRKYDADGKALANCKALKAGPCALVHDFCGS